MPNHAKIQAEERAGAQARRPDRDGWLWRRRALVGAVMLLGGSQLAAVGGCCRPVINSSPEFRWWLFSNFGASMICPEMLKIGLPLRLQDRGAAIGRYFPAQCSVDIDNQNKLVTVNFAGTGYAWHTLTKRIGFSAVASVQYRVDFYLGEEDLYLWAKSNGIPNGPSFRLGYVENPIADIATGATPLGIVANYFGNQIVAGELTRGFTVIHNPDKGNDFALGVLTPPQRPNHPFHVLQNEYFTYANEMVEIHSNQRDFIGPFEVAEPGQRLFVRYFLQGTPVDVALVDKATGDLWRDAYQTGRPLGPPPGQVLGGAPLMPGQELRTAYNPPPGSYYIVIDNSPAWGAVAPPVSVLNPILDPVATLSYVVQLSGVD
ncbi:MAG: hypothetical protein HY908_00645 [Myxococcales bacterium]|nr:hypothetical protein [Myxococcales bacterium]